MALLTIDGVAMPTPSSLTLGIQDISKAERNTRGTMIIERIATKDKLEMSWAHLTRSQLSLLLNAVKPTLFEVTYMDPETDAFRTSTFYAGDRSIAFVSFVDNEPVYKDIKFNVIER